MVVRSMIGGTANELWCINCDEEFEVVVVEEIEEIERACPGCNTADPSDIAVLHVLPDLDTSELFCRADLGEG